MPVSRNRKSHKAKIAKRVTAKKETEIKERAEYKKSITNFVETQKAAQVATKKYVNQVNRSPGRQMFITPQKEG